MWHSIKIVSFIEFEEETSAGNGTSKQTKRKPRRTTVAPFLDLSLKRLPLLHCTHEVVLYFFISYNYRTKQPDPSGKRSVNLCILKSILVRTSRSCEKFYLQYRKN